MLIRGIDYQLVGDEDPPLQTYVNEVIENQNKDPIWLIMDWIISDAAECDGLLGGLEPICEAIEDYCLAKSIHIPKLYKYIFDARGGFLTQSKAIHYLKDYWSITNNDISCPRNEDFITFISSDPVKYKLALDWFI